jgi:hypothetical protein
VCMLGGIGLGYLPSLTAWKVSASAPEPPYYEIEFLDLNLTKVSSLLLNTIHCPFYWRTLKEIMLFSGFKNPYKISTKQENLSLFMNSML